MKTRSVKRITITNLILMLLLFFLGLSVVIVIVSLREAILKEKEEAIVHQTILSVTADPDGYNALFSEAKRCYEEGIRPDFSGNSVYEKVRNQLVNICDMENYRDIYLCFYDEERDRLVYIVNGNTLIDRQAGDCLQFDPGYQEKINQSYYSDYYLCTRKDPEYGWIASCYIPEWKMASLTDWNDELEIIGYVAVDFKLKELTSYIRSLMGFCVPAFLILIFCIALLFARFLGLFLINPIVRVSASLDQFIQLDGEALINGERVFADPLPEKKLPDEILRLSSNMGLMEESVAGSLIRISNMTKEKEKRDAELSFAARIQQAMLPVMTEEYLEGKNGFSLYAYMCPAREVGGDFYDFFLIDEKNLAFLVADVSDKGVGAALFMAISKSVIRTRASLGGSPAEILRDADRLLSEGNEEGMFVTVFFGILNLETGRAAVCNAGHDYPMVCRGRDKDAAFVMLKEENGKPLAFLPGMEFPETTWELQRGSRIFLYTDGVNEAQGRSGEQFDTDRMLAVLNENKEKSDQEVCEAMKSAVDAFVNGEPQFDDMTMLCITYLGFPDSP